MTLATISVALPQAIAHGAGTVQTGIFKRPVSGPVRVHAAQLDGDGQADLVHHGGPDKAIHAYAVTHLSGWADELPAQAERFRPGAFGEILVIGGASEADVCLGDRWRIGSALVEVSQGRQPCWKLNLRFDVADMARRVQESGRTGWYFRVIEPGLIAAGDRGALVTRPHPAWTLNRTSHLFYHDRMNRLALAELAQLPGLPDNWRRLAEARLSSGRTEDWSRRLGGS